ncbi:polysulfide reductase NrfD [Saccharopolyspora sp. HNM0983]|uniref:Polysulfide reductase NrfD n=1 Tax=Saccharopolyspora montiporae TaxID=2781240 RepID=A0A929BAJ4_9PSEU|nr:NrfD/PsrC family molybdoenzyme membrane anchor subunit [Saccharopolyspora sp. HNM0983]MBE9376322.1 polysulfide reductase NrfD [Saccharopolyspora sp. HNM0983]
MTGELREAAEPTRSEGATYYGRPVIKEPVWKVPDVPAYLYLGGMAGAAALMAAGAGLTGRPGLARAGRVSSGIGATASVAFLVHDLGRPLRFLNMLRVFKPTSPLSVGSWVLAPFSALAGAGAVSAATGLLPRLGWLSSSAAAVLAPAMTTYTAVLLADTAVPAWHEPYRELPFVFAGSAVASAAGLGVVAAPAAQAGPARRMAVAGSALEVAATRRMQRRAGMVGEVFGQGRAGRLLRTAEALVVAGSVTALLARRSRIAAVASGLCLTGAGLATRFGIFEAGHASARDPRYTVEPQRLRSR